MAIVLLSNCKGEIEMTVTDVYDVRMSIYIPRVYDNMGSMGYRKVQRQRIDGKIAVVYSSHGEPRVYFRDCVNKTHRVSGVNVTYMESQCRGVRWHYIGNNRTGSFKKPSVSFSVELWPDYNVSAIVEEDNSLVVQFAGKGTASSSHAYRGETGMQTIVTLSGYVVGTLGCGCSDYGHVSPTRIAGPFGPLDYVVDVASVYGNWTARFNKKESGKIGWEEVGYD